MLVEEVVLVQQDQLLVNHIVLREELVELVVEVMEQQQEQDQQDQQTLAVEAVVVVTVVIQTLELEVMVELEDLV
tara:strand:+ start:358 stop:582 length:225 start_codon:yes stop_codon:yes gene_type:complete